MFKCLMLLNIGLCCTKWVIHQELQKLMKAVKWLHVVLGWVLDLNHLVFLCLQLQVNNAWHSDSQGELVWGLGRQTSAFIKQKMHKELGGVEVKKWLLTKGAADHKLPEQATSPLGYATHWEGWYLAGWAGTSGRLACTHVWDSFFLQLRCCTLTNNFFCHLFFSFWTGPWFFWPKRTKIFFSLI